MYEEGPMFANYQRDLEGMLRATQAWAAANPNATLDFRGLNHRDSLVLGSLMPRIRTVGGNPKTRELLRAMNAAIEGQGTVLQADACIEFVFGIQNAISGPPVVRYGQPQQDP